MRFRSLRVAGLGPFTTDRTFAIEDQAGPLVAIAGPNGVGKTTLLELLLGAIYRQCPTRGSLHDLATARDAFVELDVEYGAGRYRFRQTVDAVSKKGESLITNGDGRPVVESTKVKAADAWVADHFPPMGVVLVSTFAAQKSGGFLACKPAERKSLLLKMLGVERIEEIAGRARELARETAAAIGVTQARINELQSMPQFAVLASAGLAHINTPEQLAEHFVAKAKTDLEAQIAFEAVAAQRLVEAQAEAVEFDRRRERWDQQRAAKQKLLDEVGVLHDRAKDLDTRLTRVLGILGREDAITSAVAALESLQQRQAKLTADVAAIDQEVRNHTTRKGELQRLATAAANRVRSARAALAQRDAVTRAVDSIAALRTRIAESGGEVTSLERLKRELQEQRVAGAEERIVGLRGGLETIAARQTAAMSIAIDTLGRDDEAVQQAVELPRNIAVADKDLSTARAALDTAMRELSRAEALAAQAPHLERAQADLDAATQEEARAGAELTTTSTLLQQAQTVSQSTRRQIQEIADAMERQRPLAVQQAALNAAKGTAEALGPELKAANEALKLKRLEYESAPQPPLVDLVPPAMAELEAAAKEAQADLRRCTLALDRAEQELAQAKQRGVRVAELTLQLGLQEDDLADWQRLGSDLGKDGLQATLIDNALPELVTLTNQLLHTAFGPRFTLDVKTQVADAQGKRLLETLDVIVIDSERGREGMAETYSGGEEAILAEALSLALTTIACRSAGVERPTLVRDEAGAALDPERTRQWMQMLRHAATLIGADKVLFVSHNAECRELADSVIELQ